MKYLGGELRTLSQHNLPSLFCNKVDFDWPTKYIRFAFISNILKLYVIAPNKKKYCGTQPFSQELSTMTWGVFLIMCTVFQKQILCAVHPHYKLRDGLVEMEPMFLVVVICHQNNDYSGDVF